LHIKEKISIYNELFEDISVEILSSIKLFKNNVILLKGITFSETYPKIIKRDMVDIDLYAINNKIAFECATVLLKKDWEIDKFHLNPTELDYSLEIRLIHKKFPFIVCEVHNNVTSFTGGTYLKTNLWESTIQKVHKNQYYYTCNITNGVLYMIAHLFHHGHFKIRDLFDLYFYIQFHREDIDKKELLFKLNENKLEYIFQKLIYEIKQNINSEFSFNLEYLPISFFEKMFINIMYKKSSEFSIYWELPYKYYYLYKFHNNLHKTVKSSFYSTKYIIEYLLLMIKKKYSNFIFNNIWNFSSTYFFKREKLALLGMLPQYSLTGFQFTDSIDSQFDSYLEKSICSSVILFFNKKNAFIKTDIGFFNLLTFDNNIMFNNDKVIEGVSIKNVSKNFNKKIYANNNITLNLEKGKIIGLIGANGSGKTTLINLILGRLSLNSGSILINGKTVKQYLKTNTISYIPQEFGLYEFLTVEEHIKHLASIHNYKFNEDLFTELGLDKLSNKKIFNLSGGEKKRVLLCLALMPNSNILIIDELTANIDFNWRWRIIEILNNYKKIYPDCLIIYTSHNLDEVESFSEKIILLDNVTVL
jgi:ABC-type Mn2+/Zn2+ transport system ATPase subunit